MADSQAITSQGNGNPRVSTKQVDETERLPAEEELQRTREQISQTTNQIQERLRASADWKLWMDRYPLAFTALAGSAGFLTGLALSGPGSKPSRSSGKGAPSRREEELVKQSGTSAVVATVLTNVATAALREGAQYLVQQLFAERRP